ncbi:MAG: bifunctional ornithine acetyltransferase/N-acetylglutamate synthase [Heyndrickxia sp.]
MVNSSSRQLEIEKGSLMKIESGNIATPIGFLAGGMHSGLKRKRKDLGWLYSQVPAVSAAVYTTNQFQAAPLKVTQESLAASPFLQGVIINSGNANACTGELGMQNAFLMREWFAEHMDIQKHEAAVCSTGVIGEQLPIEKIQHGISQIPMTDGPHHAEDFSEAILTTDTFVKNVCVSLLIDDRYVTIGGTAKGSGMIHPNMATMLGFITTDAKVNPSSLQEALSTTVNDTFNMITVDGDTSTNDMVLVMANGLAGNQELSESHPDWPTFLEGLNMICTTLAKQIARDGEGATKLIEVHVNGAKSSIDAKIISKSIIGSNLVKAAIFGEDANWGRIVNAIGYSGVAVNPNLLTVSIGDIKVVANGLPAPFSEEAAKQYLQSEIIEIFVDLGEGQGNATAWGCDLSYDYVKINASYRT